MTSPEEIVKGRWTHLPHFACEHHTLVGWCDFIRLRTSHGVGLLFRHVSDDRQFEHLSLQSFHHQHHPHHDETETDHHGNQVCQEMAQERNDEQDDGDKFQQSNHDKSSGPDENALERMKTHKSVLLIGIKKQKDECGDKGEV